MAKGVILADTFGFCYGVKRAVDMANEQRKARTLGFIVHNKNVVNKLAERNIKPASSVDEVNSGTFIINAHGTKISTLKKAQKKNLTLIDTTCPFVKRVHNIVKKYEKESYKTIIVGEPKHREVEGISSYAKKPIIIENLEQANNIKLDKALLVSQTTQRRELFNKVYLKLKKNIKELKVFNTICNATAERQNAARNLAKNVDLMLVVGDKLSGNTKRLYEVCKDITETKRVETADEIKEGWHKGKIVGITAGASTPDWTIEEVLKKLKKGKETFMETLRKYKRLTEEEAKLFFNEKILERNLSTQMENYYELLQEFVLNGGKRLRPTSLIMAYKGLGGKKDITREALSVELFHNSTLIHDDIMDEDDFRRGKPTVYKVLKDEYLKKFKEKRYGGPLFNRESSRVAVSNAILMGNILQTLGAECLSKSKLDTKKVKRSLEIYHETYLAVNDGQLLDNLLEKKSDASEKDYIEMAEKKSAYLVRASIEIGTVLAGANRNQIEALRKYAMNITLAFQIQDDIMDISPHMKKGHELGSDIKQGKRTLLVVKALELGRKEERKAILKTLGKIDAGKKELNKTIELLYSTGAVQYCKEFAEKKIIEGKKWLKKAKLKKESYEFFNNFADFMINRDI